MENTFSKIYKGKKNILNQIKKKIQMSENKQEVKSNPAEINLKVKDQVKIYL